MSQPKRVPQVNCEECNNCKLEYIKQTPKGIKLKVYKCNKFRWTFTRTKTHCGYFEQKPLIEPDCENCTDICLDLDLGYKLPCTIRKENEAKTI